MSHLPLAELNDRAWAVCKEDPSGALELALQAEAEARRREDGLALGRALRTQGACRLEQGAFDDARALLEAARELLQEQQGGKVALAECHRLLARLGFLNHDFDPAVRHAHSALKAAQEAGEVQVRAAAMNDLGMLYAQLGSYREGLEFLLGSLRLLEEQGVPPAGGPLNNIGNVYLLQDDPERALDFFERASAAFEENGTRRQRLIALANVGRALECLGELEQALAIHDRCLRSVQEMNDVTYLPPALTKYGAVLGKLGRREEALAYFEEALARSEASGWSFRDETVFALADLHLDGSEYELAEPLFRRALSEADANGDSQRRAQAYLGLSRSLEGLGRWPEALECFRKYHELDRKLSRELFSNQAQALLLHNEINQAKRERQLLRGTNERLSTAYEELRQLHGALEEKTAELQRLSLEDPLTKLPNRRELEQRLDAEVGSMRRFGGTFGLVMCDIDDFKAINDHHSHVVGDEILVRVGELLRSNVREADFVARLGGEEFVLLLPGTRLVDALTVAEKIRKAVAEFRWQDLYPNLRVTLSAGVTEAGTREDGTATLRRADLHLYGAKRMGKNTVCCDQEAGHATESVG